MRIVFIVFALSVATTLPGQHKSIFADHSIQNVAVSFVPTSMLVLQIRGDVQVKINSKYALVSGITYYSNGGTRTEGSISNSFDLSGLGSFLQVRRFLNSSEQYARPYIGVEGSFLITDYHYSKPGWVEVYEDDLPVLIYDQIQETMNFKQYGGTLLFGIEFSKSIYTWEVFAGIGHKWCFYKRPPSYENEFSDFMSKPGYQGFHVVAGLKLGAYIL